MRSKIFWLIVLAMTILIAVISCQSPRGDLNAGVDLIVPFPTHEEPDYEYPPYEYEYEEPEIEEPTPPDPGELAIETKNTFVGGRYAGFLTWGYFRHSYAIEDIAILGSSVIDMYTSEELKVADIFDMERLDTVFHLLSRAIMAHAPEAEPYLGHMNASWLEHFVLDNDGIGVLLPPNTIPGFCFIYVVLCYEDLCENFVLGVELGLREPPPRRLVALTFDDGPVPYTDMILDLLEEHGGRATFCVLGSRIQNHPEILVRAVALGSEVIGHSWNHSDFTRLNAAGVTSQITQTSDAIEAIIGQRPPRLVRAPYGNLNNRAINTARELGYALLHWSVDPQDWHNRNAEVIYYNIMKRVTEGSIILLHDIHTTTAEAMVMVIPRLIAEGFELVTASELIAYHYGELEPGEIYVGFRNAPW